MQKSYRVVILLSGTGTTLQSILDTGLAGEIVAVISNKADAKGLERAAKAGIANQAIEHSRFDSREEFDLALQQEIDLHLPDLVVLAGFMRVLSPAFVNHYAGRIINIHPSLLPDYKGMHTHQRAMDAGEPLHGSSVHFVNTDLDSGPVLLQARMPILPSDTVESLELRVKAKEHIIYPTAVSWLAEGRIKLLDGEIYMDDKRMTSPVIIDYM